ncbi:hypothetical protein BVX98_06620, partial [bacterium F11]
FELKASDDQPQYWANSASGVGSDFNYEFGYTTSTVFSGFQGIALKAGVGNTAHYESGYFMKLSSGAAFMITGKIARPDANNNGTIRLESNAFVTLGSITTTKNNWDKLKFRYPASGFYDGTLPQNEVKIILSAQNTFGTPEWVYFDEIALTPIHAVITSTNSPSGVNINNTTSDPPDNVMECSGYRFSRWENETIRFGRYRIGQWEKDKYVIREMWDPMSSSWYQEPDRPVGLGIASLKFSYDIDSDLPNNGKDIPLSFYWAFREGLTEKKSKETKTMVLPMGP